VTAQNMLDVADPIWRETAKRARVLTALAAHAHCSTQQITEAAKKLKIGRAMVYRLLARFKSRRDTTSILPARPGRKLGRKVLKQQQEHIIAQQINKVYLSRQKPSIAALHRIIGLECFNANLQIPSYKTVRSRVGSLDPQEVVRKREGARAAAERFRPLKLAPQITAPLELVQIDHTLVDVIVVDELERRPIGRPWVTLVIDVATRIVLGFYVSLRHPSASSVALAISHAVLQKDRYLSSVNVHAEWPAYGLPQKLHLDNAKEFRSRALIRGCEQHGIRISYRPPLTPHFGGHVERLIGTLMGDVHLLPGTTFSSIKQRGDYDSAKHAAMTLADLEKWMVWQVAGIYHTRSHSALGCTPLSAWRQGVASLPSPPKEPFNAQRFYLDFLPFEKRSVGREGLRLFNIFFWHGALARYVRDGKKHLLKYDPRDLSQIYLLESDGSYLEVPYRDLSHGRVSLDEVATAARSLRASGQSTDDQGKLFQAIERQRELIESATSTTLKARRQMQRHKENPRKPVAPPPTQPLRETDGDSPAEPFPFEIWK
jgi:putative transposase